MASAIVPGPRPPSARSSRSRGAQACTIAESRNPSTSAHQTSHAIRKAFQRPSPICASRFTGLTVAPGRKNAPRGQRRADHSRRLHLHVLRPRRRRRGRGRRGLLLRGRAAPLELARAREREADRAAHEPARRLLLGADRRRRRGAGGAARPLRQRGDARGRGRPEPRPGAAGGAGRGALRLRLRRRDGGAGRRQRRRPQLGRAEGALGHALARARGLPPRDGASPSTAPAR